MDVSLVMFKADGSRRDFPVRKDHMVLGRKNTCDLRIPLSSVSRQHCEIRIEDGVARIRDLDSSNGTFHNHNRVQESELSPGDKIAIGPVVFTVQIDGEPEEIEPVRTVMNEQEEADTDGSGVFESHHDEVDQGVSVQNATQSGEHSLEDMPIAATDEEGEQESEDQDEEEDEVLSMISDEDEGEDEQMFSMSDDEDEEGEDVEDEEDMLSMLMEDDEEGEDEEDILSMLSDDDEDEQDDSLNPFEDEEENSDDSKAS